MVDRIVEYIYLLDSPVLRCLLIPERSNYVSEIFSERQEQSEYHKIYKKLFKLPKQFSKHYGVTPDTFDYILEEIKDDIHKESNFRTCIPARQRLAITLRFLLTGLSFRVISVAYKISPRATSQIINETCRSIIAHFLKKHMPTPNTQDFKKISNTYLNKWNFPHCIGSIAGKHVFIRYLSMASKKNKHSIILQGIADCNYKFVLIDVGECQKVNMTRNFKETKLYTLLESNTLNIPQDECLPGSETPLPYVFVGSKLHPLKHYLMRPYVKNDDPQERFFNERLADAVLPIERAFGLLFSKWRSLQDDLQMCPANAKVIIECVCLLHNIVIDKEGVPKDVENVQFVSSQNTLSNQFNRCTKSAAQTRDCFKKYIYNERIKTECS